MRELGVQKGDRVSILDRNSVVLLDLLYGLAKIGAIFAPLNFRLVPREVSYILNDCQPKVLIYGAEYADVIRESRNETTVPYYVSLGGLGVEGDPLYEESVAKASTTEPERPILEADDTYAILYTSGTTGYPKGAMIPHRQVLWNCINTTVSWGLTENDVSPVFTPLFHAGGLFAFLTPILYAGGRIVLFRASPVGEILKAILEEQCTVILGVPSLYKMIMQDPSFPDADFGHVRFFISGGAPLDVSLVEAWLAAKGGVFRQGYGLTEAGVNCFSMTDEESVRKMGSVGKPIFHSQMRIVDEEDNQVPVGETGELVISGPHVCTGYWRNPEATAEALRGGWFHTGDMARKDADGFYYIVGRFKDMIISGGENIYAAEVEAVFKEHPAVAEAALIGQPDAQWGEVGLMLVVLAEGASVTKDALKAHCRERLARYKTPKKIIFVDSLPYSSYGKVIKSELRARYVPQE
jgi:fatty-acyl-CoA synthase